MITIDMVSQAGVPIKYWSFSGWKPVEIDARNIISLSSFAFISLFDIPAFKLQCNNLKGTNATSKYTRRSIDHEFKCSVSGLDVYN
jgi:hypothetical protein